MLSCTFTCVRAYLCDSDARPETKRQKHNRAYCRRGPNSTFCSSVTSPCFVDLSSASEPWCGECLCCEPSAWSSRAPCSPCWSRHPSWKVGEKNTSTIADLKRPDSSSLRDSVTCMSPVLLFRPIHSFAYSCYATTQSVPMLFYSLEHVMQGELNTQGLADEPFRVRIPTQKRGWIKYCNGAHRGNRTQTQNTSWQKKLAFKTWLLLQTWQTLFFGDLGSQF